ncbi:REJ domain-containing protein [Madurella fahalii]|uniref:REJ domain-containing protein n=1 Tax=Madurella fahalii TaxID=1157608 RepID=A0ABQ0G005_9PEZI
MAPSDSQRTRQPEQRDVSSVPETVGPSHAASPQRRNDGQLDATVSGRDQRLTTAISESWIEVASQPSSSSLSSIGEDIVTTGLRVGSTSYQPRRRRSQQQQPMPASFIVGHPASQAGATSSQEEYDETESEEERVMTSSTEAIHPSASLLRQQTAIRAAVESDSDSDDDENATALGRPSNTPVFRPQPNAFSHPPSHLTHRHSTGSAHPYHQSRPSMPNRPHTRPHRGQPNYMSPSYQADNDAALRASLTTLLSCAAAARGLPKQQEERRTPGAPGAGVGVIPSSQPMELRLVPESELMAETPPPAPAGGAAGPGPAAAKASPQARTASNSSAPSAPSSNSGREKTKRTAAAAAATTTNTTTTTTAQGNNKPSRAAKKKRTGGAAALLEGEASAAATAPFLSPTLLTWVVSAGVVVLVSVVGFGAGYVIGREVGRQEAAASFGGFGSSSSAAGTIPSNASSCGRELVKSTASAGGGGTLRRFRWGDVSRSVAA